MNKYIANAYAALSFETTAGLIMKHNYVAAMQVLILKLPIWQWARWLEFINSRRCCWARETAAEERCTEEIETASDIKSGMLISLS